MGDLLIATRTLGQVITQARKARGMSQKDLAAAIERENGNRGISPAYLNDIEHDRRSPSDEALIKQFAQHLQLDASYLLMLAAKQLPGELALKAQSVDPTHYNRALVAFRRALDKK